MFVLSTLITPILKIVPDTQQMFTKYLWPGGWKKGREGDIHMQAGAYKAGQWSGSFTESLLKQRISDTLDIFNQIRTRICKCLYFTFIYKINLNCLKNYKTLPSPQTPYPHILGHSVSVDPFSPDITWRRNS